MLTALSGKTEVIYKEKVMLACFSTENLKSRASGNIHYKSSNTMTSTSE